MTKNILILLMVLFLGGCSSTKRYAEKARSWEPDIVALESKDKIEKHDKDAILYIGSSSIRFWNNIEKDMAPYKAIKRGYGGAKFTDLIYYTKRLVYPHEFKALVVFVANDITGSVDDKTPREVLGLFKGVVKIVRKKYKTQPIYFVAITPTMSRWAVWDKQKEANALIKSYCKSSKNMHFIDTQDAYLGVDGKPIDEYFIGDKLHQTQKGYDVWASIIKSKFNETLK